MYLNLFQLAMSGHRPSAWRHPLADPEHAADLDTLVRVAQLAESACFDSIFLADSQHLWPGFEYEEMRWMPDALVMLSALAARTQRIGLIATINVTFGQPYDFARKLATLDRMSGGRTGYNVVTGNADAEAQNYGLSGLADPVERYAQAEEFVEVAKKLWASWDDDALLFDKDSGLYADPDRVHAIDHDGPHFRCSGPLNVPALPQRHPVLVQAGQSQPGRDFAARFAEVIFTAQTDIDEAVSFAEDIRSRARQCGRDPGEIKILPGLIPILGDTEADAQRLDRELRETLLPTLGFQAIRTFVGIDLSGYDPDDPVPSDPDVLESLAVDKQRGSFLGSRRSVMLENAVREGATVRDLMFATGARAHMPITGTGEQVADRMQHWFEAGACDGFNIAPALLAQTEQFVSDVIPVLCERGLFPTEYTGTTLREHLGLPRPHSTLSPLIPSPT